MGLNITAYADCRRVNLGPDQEGPSDCGVVKAWVNADFPRQADDIVHLGHYRYAASTTFSAGSYHGYDAFRAALARVGRYDAEDAFRGKVVGAPFIDLVNFADNEGVIGPKTSSRLADEFVAHERVARHLMSPQHFAKYLLWKDAFIMARRGGFIRFH